ncbi:MAG: divergent polysaccharide deacetylase family protein [Candidatus Latescibacteria bacterium]|nr:divergent polysaccharide deacetylase family protein [Candidatus Latescibacterota bacterium]
MKVKQKKRLQLYSNIFLPLIALIALGVSSYLWYKALKPEKTPPPVIKQSKVAPKAFSAGLQGNLVEVLADMGIDEKSIKREDADKSTNGVYQIYTIRTPENASLTLLNQRITIMAKNMGGSVFSGIEGSNGKTLTITLGAGKTPTDIVIFKKIPGIEPSRAKMAVIIDDVGIRNLNSIKRLCDLDQTVTLSILPFQTHTSHAVDLAIDTDTPYMLHMPMEPKSSNTNPGEGAILDSDNKDVIIEKLNDAFRSVRGAHGLNNHMGSKVTENIRIVEVIMDYLSSNRYFFVDSKTSLNTIGYQTSHKTGVKSAIIDGYLDVSDNKDDIANKLDKLSRQAFTNGLAVVICHDRPNTLDVLEKKLPELEKQGIKFVRISDLVK